jgi:hypothetical protein
MKVSIVKVNNLTREEEDVSDGLVAYKGDENEWKYTFTKDDGDAVNLKNAKIHMVVSRKKNNDPLILEKHNELAGGSDAEIDDDQARQGIIVLHVLTEDTAGLSPVNYYYQITVEKAGKTTTIIDSTFKIIESLLY